MLRIPNPIRLVTFCLLFACYGLCAVASEFRETTEFADAVERVEKYAEQYGAKDTLLVVDIDNTLLAMNDTLGSDQWFEWQSFLLEHDKESPDLVADTFPELLAVQGLLFTVGKMRAPQEDLPNLIARVQGIQVPTLVLTSRGDEFRVATERELKANGYDFVSSALSVNGLPEEPYAPYELDALSKSGLTADDARLYGLEEPRDVGFENGVFMVSGQHKGVMLLTMLHHACHKPKAVVFVDDHGRHVNRVYDALVRRCIEVTVFHYKREDPNVNRFRYADKTDVGERWRRLEAALGEVDSLPEEEPVGAETEPVLQGAAN